MPGSPIRAIVVDAPISSLIVGLMLACPVLAVCTLIFDFAPVPDLPNSEAAKMLSQTPEFTRIGRLLNVESVHHSRGSMDSVASGLFTLALLNSTSNRPVIQGNASFRYWDRAWHLAGFSYGCDHNGFDATLPVPECQVVDVAMHPQN